MAEVKLVSELFMIVLCILAGPFGEKDVEEELLIDLIGERGYVDTMIVAHTDRGYGVYDKMNEELVAVALIQPSEDKEHVYICTDAKGKKEVVDLPQSIVDFKSMDLSKAKRDVLKLKDGLEIRLSRSGDIAYLTSVEQKRTYVVHKNK
ncbi:hypothetical protein ACFL6S_05565 [Candidatus Poribacteria bacterium]